MADNTYVVTRSATIAAPPARIYEQIADFRNWTKWSPWEDVDPQLQRTYAGTGAGVGAVYGWSGNRKAGQGQMEIIEAVEASKVRIDLIFEKPFAARNDTTLDIQPDGSGSRVTWTMTGQKTLMTRVMGIFVSMDKLIGPDFEKGLAQLKTVTEQPAAS